MGKDIKRVRVWIPGQMLWARQLSPRRAEIVVPKREWGARSSSLSWLGTQILFLTLSSVQFSSVAQSCPALCDPMNRSTPGLPIHHHLPEFTQTHVHWVGDATQPSHPLSSPFPPAPNPSQHQSLFQWVNSSHEVAMQLFVLHVLTLSQLPKKMPRSTLWNNSKGYQEKKYKGQLGNTIYYHNSLLQKTIENYNSVNSTF